ncbi:hypothetical protein DI487_08420 [Flavobacterium sediminis]|uniref:Uncharacterized protein n=1 Tax=Flavobacterium sediminis TaxID=2201181 RepID=A0A2U8QUS9_9FLAO|nr:DUF6252 family protein [Flavobacterium sediminis]AWM13883.1 hypothetical protein DI487_08420 [Flavobacterium sediminis]
MKKILSLALFAVVLVSCNQDIKTNTPAFQAKINDANWRANDARVSLGENNGIVITAFTAYEELVLETSSTNPGHMCWELLIKIILRRTTSIAKE